MKILLLESRKLEVCKSSVCGGDRRTDPPRVHFHQDDIEHLLLCVGQRGGQGNS